jgi:hypothetical protein
VKERVESLTLLVTSIGITLISLLDFFGVLDGISFLKQHIPTMTLGVLGIVLGYLVFERRTKIDKLEGLTQGIYKLTAKGTQDIEVFHTTSEFLEKMIEVTVGSERVSTLNLSPAKGTTSALDKYFANVHRYIKKPGTSLQSFRSIASLESLSKARWVLERSEELVSSGKVSVSLFGPEINNFLFGFHVVHKAGVPFVFFYRPVDPSGLMDCFLLKHNTEVADIILKYFEVLWNSCTILHQGKKVDKRGLQLILNVDKSLVQNKSYLVLEQMANSYK